MTNFIETEETKQQLEVLKNKQSVLLHMKKCAERQLEGIKEELKLLEILIEDYDGFGLLWSENNEE